MGLHLSIDLTETVTIRDLQRFLAYVKEDADTDADIRWLQKDGMVRYLEIEVGNRGLPSLEDGA